MTGSDDVAAIERVLVRYATAIDTRDWDLFRSCFAPDLKADYGDYGRWADVDGITAYMERAHLGFEATNHLLSNFVIEVDGDRASAVSYVHVVLVFGGESTSWIDGIGRYEDRLVRTGEGWRIAQRTFHRTRLLVDGVLAPTQSATEQR